MDSKLSSEMMLEILSRTSLKTLDTMRCTSKEFNKLTYDPYLPNLCKQRNNIVSGILKQGVRKDIKNFEPSHESNNLDLDFLPLNARIVATSEQGIVVFKIHKMQNYWNNVEYYVCKPATKQVLALPYLKNSYTYEAAMVAIVVVGSNPLHYKIVRWSHTATKPCDIFDSMTWEWRQNDMSRLPFSIIQTFRQPITTRGSIYMLLQDDKVLKFDAFLEKSTMFSLPVPMGEYPFAQQLIKYEGKLGFAVLQPSGYWEIWFLTTDESWEKIYKFEDKREAPDGLFGSGMSLTDYCNTTPVLLIEQLDYRMFTFRSDFEAVDLAPILRPSIWRRLRGTRWLNDVVGYICMVFISLILGFVLLF